MWTNIFKIGDLHLISWFQFLPSSDSNTLSGKRAEQKDAATHSILSSHLKLQNEGLLSSWTNSFVGPWDPSQGVHNPDEKIKLWLFLPGHHTSVVDSAKSLLSGLRVVTSGIWLAPGDSEEVAIALSHALRNRIERALRGLSYVRFGDVFIRWHPFSTIEKNSRRVQPAFEFIFSATEEAIYVHTIISAKNVRGLSNNDLERALKHSSSHSNREGFSVIVASNGMRGRLTGCCPTDLVKQVYSTNSSNGSIDLGAPSQFPGCQLRGQSCYVEVTLGCLSGSTEKTVQSTSSPSMNITQHCTKSNPGVADERGEKKAGLSDTFPIFEKTLIFPVETVLVPILYKAFAKSSLKRIWLRGSSGTSLSGMASSWNHSDSNFITYCLGFGGSGDIRLADSLLGESIDMHRQRKYNNRNYSNSSSISSTSSTSNNSDDANTSVARELEADADSLSCRQPGLSSNDQLEKDGYKRASKRSRTEMAGSFDQACNVASGSVIDPYTSNHSPAGFQVESIWDWDEGRGIDVDIVDVLAEYGSFDEFFEDDNFDLGELPGTEESQTLMFSATDGGEISSSPFVGKSDGPEQTTMPCASFPPLEEHIQDIVPINSEFLNQNMESTMDTGQSAITGNSTITSKYDYLKKAEAMLTVIPGYSAVETPFSEFSTSIFRTPYLPKSKCIEKPSGLSSYVYSTTPQLRLSEEKVEAATKAKMVTGDYDMISSNSKYYNYVNGRKNYINKKSSRNDEMTLHEDDNLSSVSGITLPSSSTSFQGKNTDSTLETGYLLMSLKTVLATEAECSMYQASMHRIRHTLLFCNNQVPKSLGMPTGQGLSIQSMNDQSTMANMISSRYGMKKKDSIPVRIAGDIDSVPDHSVTAPLGVWRVVAPSKSTKISSMLNVENSSSFSKNSVVEDFPKISRRQPLQELLDAIALLVQQSTSFVDVSLDTCDGDGPYDLLALEEQIRRGFVCGPSSVHAGCGGVLASCHSVDIAGVDLVDPLSTDVHVSSVISLLHSDVKVAMRAAFRSLDGPLSVIEWCKGRSQSADTMITGDIHYAECNNSEVNDSSSEFIGEAISPSTFASSTSSLKDGGRIDESSQRRPNQEPDQKISGSHNRPTISVLPLPALLVGYQDDWLKTSANILEVWEKGPLEPYALPKPLTYCAVCPDIDILTSASADFLQQIGTVYESCKLGTHLPHLNGSQLDIASKRWSTSGLVLVDCPQTMKAGTISTSAIGPVNDYLTLLNDWDLKSFLVSLANSLKALKLGSNLSANQKDGTNVPTMVVYVVCPFPDTTAVLQTLVESCVALGSAVHASEKESRTMLHSQIAKDLNCAAAADEALASNVVMLSGFSIPKLVLQIVSLDLLLRVNKPRNERSVLKDLAFTVYNKARRTVRPFSNCDMIQSQSIPGRSHSALMHVSSPSPGFWKDCLAPRISAPGITREGELDSAIRPGVWDNSWQTLRTSGGLNCDSNRSIENWTDNFRCMFEPLFILAEPGSVEHVIPLVGYNNASSESSNSRSLADDSSYMQTSASGGIVGINTSALLDDADHEHKAPSLHCCYGWTEDWRWLICIWTDSKGELLDSQIFPFGGISSRQDTKVLQCLFVQILQQGCQIISSSPDSASTKLRDIIITRIGCFFELECQEWQRAIYSVGGNEVKKWPVQLRRSVSIGTSSTNNGPSLQQQDISLIQERSMPSSPLPSMYSPHAKSSGYMKGALGQSNFKKTISGCQPMDCPRGLSQLVQSISLIAVSVDHSLHLMIPTDASLLGGVNQNGNGNSTTGYLEGFSSVTSLGTIPSSYMFIPTPSVRYLPPSPSQLPTCLTSESPPLAHLLHSKGSAIPLSTGYVVSKAVPSVRKGLTGNSNEEWPSILSVTLIDHYGANIDNFQEKMVRGGGNSSVGVKQGNSSSGSGRSSCLEANIRDYELEKHLVLESISAELHSLSWMTVSPVYLERRTALPFHCDMLLRSRRLLYYADKHLALQLDK